MESLLGVLAGFVIVVIIIAFGIYIAQAIFLNKFNKLVNKKGTPMAWIPIANIYLLGKLTVNKVVGLVLVFCSFSTMTITTTINGVETTRTILPESISSIISPLYSIAILGLFIYAIIKYNKLKKSNSGTIPTAQQSINSNQSVQNFNQNILNNNQSSQGTGQNMTNVNVPIQSTQNVGLIPQNNNEPMQNIGQNMTNINVPIQPTEQNTQNQQQNPGV